jgi:hypothetical protein
MKKSRRIKITAFRRCTTIVLRKLDGSRIRTAGFCEGTKEPLAVADSSDPTSKATINKRRDDHECKNQKT